MNTPYVYIAVSIAVLAVVAVLAFFVRGRSRANRLTPLAGLAFGFVVAGLIFGDDRLVGYSLLAVGVVLAVVDMITRSRHKPTDQS